MTEEQSPKTHHEISEEESHYVKRLIQWGHNKLNRAPEDTPICPLVTSILLETKPGSPIFKRNYKDNVEDYLKKKGAKNVSIDDEQFHDRVNDLCRGIAFVYDKFKDELGPDCLEKLNEYHIFQKCEFIAGHPTDQFYAIVQPANRETGDLAMVLQSGIFALHAQNNCRLRDRIFRDDKIDGKFNASEMLTLIGVEEAMHAIQFSRGQTTTYDPGKVTANHRAEHKKYQNDPMEREVKGVLEEAARELKLGSEYGRKMGNPSTGRIVG